MRVLLIEDDLVTAGYVAAGLRERGHAVDHVANGRAALARAAGADHALLIVDRMLPGLDGLSLVRRLREAGAGGNGEVRQDRSGKSVGLGRAAVPLAGHPGLTVLVASDYANLDQGLAAVSSSAQMAALPRINSCSSHVSIHTGQGRAVKQNTRANEK